MATSANALNAEQAAALRALLDNAQGTDPAAAPTAQAAPEPLQFNFGGHQYTARDQNELQRLLDQAQAQQTSQVEAERIQAEAQLQRAQQEQRQPLPQATDQFSK